MPDRRADPAPSAIRQRVQTWLLASIAVVLAGWALHVMAVVFVPVVFAAFLALLVAPVDRWVAERVPGKLRWLGYVAAMGIILVVLAVFVGSLWFAAQRVVGHLPDISGELPSLLSQAEAPDGAAPSEARSGRVLGQLGEVFSGAGGALTSRFQDYASQTAASVLRAAGTTLGATALVFFFTLLMLIETPRWRSKLADVLTGSETRESFEAVGVIADRLRRYLLARTILGVLTALLYAGWLWLFGIDLLIVWALLAFLLNFVPTLGSLVAGILPVIYAFVQKDFGTAALVGTGILVIEQIMGNFVDPRVQGRQVAVSPLVVLTVLLVWGWIWGIPGTLLAVPVTIAMVITFAHVSALRPIALLLSSERDLEGLDRIASR
jgi:AI-2 transport protein TqsA